MESRHRVSKTQNDASPLIVKWLRHKRISSNYSRNKILAKHRRKRNRDRREAQRGVESLHGAVNDNPTANNFNSIPRIGLVSD